MEFWGVEVKSGKPLSVTNDFGKMLHLSQATMGESKEENTGESVRIFVTVDGQKFALGILSNQNNPQLLFDLVLEKDFELSHDWKSGSVFFLGYKTLAGEYSDDELDSEEEPVFSLLNQNGKIGAKDKLTLSATAKGDTKVEPTNKPKSKAGPIKKEAEAKEDDEDDSSDDEDYTDEDEEMITAYNDDCTDGDDSDGSDGDDDEDGDESEDGDEDEETPKADLSKKRSNESATKTPVPATKKAKFASPQKTEGKKGSHTATPHPKLQAGKTPAGNKKDQTPKSGGSQVSCNSCKKTFNSDSALQSHTKAKHGPK